MDQAPEGLGWRRLQHGYCRAHDWVRSILDSANYACHGGGQYVAPLRELWRRIVLVEVSAAPAMRLWSKKETAKVVGVHPEHIMRLARQGRFPRPIKLGNTENCAVRFVANEVEAWITARMAARS